MSFYFDSYQVVILKIQSCLVGLSVGTVLVVKFFLLFVFIHSFILVWAHGVLLQSFTVIIFLLLKLSQTWPIELHQASFFVLLTSHSTLWTFVYFLLKKMFQAYLVFSLHQPWRVIPSRSLSFFQWRNQGVFTDTVGMGWGIPLFLGFVSRCCREIEVSVSVCAYTQVHPPTHPPILFSVFVLCIYLSLHSKPWVHTNTCWHCFLDFYICNSFEFLLKPKWFWNS